MTTTVSVKACCDSKTKKVEVKILTEDEEGKVLEVVDYLEDGESSDFVVYDDRKIVVSEVLK